MSIKSNKLKKVKKNKPESNSKIEKSVKVAKEKKPEKVVKKEKKVEKVQKVVKEKKEKISVEPKKPEKKIKKEVKPEKKVEKIVKKEKKLQKTKKEKKHNATIALKDTPHPFMGVVMRDGIKYVDEETVMAMRPDYKLRESKLNDVPVRVLEKAEAENEDMWHPTCTYEFIERDLFSAIWEAKFYGIYKKTEVGILILSSTSARIYTML